MNCRKADILISAYIDNELSGIEKVRLEKHLSECSSCRKKAEALRALSDRMKGLGRIEGDLASRNRVLSGISDQIRKEPQPKAIPVFRIPAYAGWVAAAAIAVVLIAVLITIPKPANNGTGLNQPPDTAVNLYEGWEDEFIAGLVEYMEMERIQASSSEVYAEPVAVVFLAQPVEPLEGTLDSTSEQITPAQG